MIDGDKAKFVFGESRSAESISFSTISMLTR